MTAIRQSRRFQFTLQQSLAIIAALAAWLAIQTSVAFRFRFVFELCAVVTSLALLVSTICYAKGNLRAFAIGALFPPLIGTAMMITMSSELMMLGPFIISADYPLPDDGAYTARGSLAWVPASIVLGIASVIVRRCLADTSCADTRILDD